MQNLQHTEVNLWPFMVNALRKYEVYQMPFLNASFIFEFIFCIYSWDHLWGRDPHHVQDQHQRVQRQFLLWEIQFSQQSQHHLLCICQQLLMANQNTGEDTFWLVWLLLEYSNVSKMIWSSLIWKSFIQLCTGISLHLMVHKIESALKWQCVMLPDA